jgi:opacity protein-like surface antigen
MAAGLSIGYLHSELNAQRAASLDGVHVDLNQFPVLAIARVRVPVETWAEVFLSAMAGWTLARTTISGSQGVGSNISTATASGTTVGLGAEATLPLDPGQLVFGARYLSATLGKTSEGDNLRGNSLGLICDLGFKLGF